MTTAPRSRSSAARALLYVVAVLLGIAVLGVTFFGENLRRYFGRSCTMYADGHCVCE